MKARISSLRELLNRTTASSTQDELNEKSLETVMKNVDQELRVNGATYRVTRKPPLEILASDM